jgi:hypothetical protein
MGIRKLSQYSRADEAPVPGSQYIMTLSSISTVAASGHRVRRSRSRKSSRSASGMSIRNAVMSSFTAHHDGTDDRAR